jgi:hypothetical protein
MRGLEGILDMTDGSWELGDGRWKTENASFGYGEKMEGS